MAGILLNITSVEQALVANTAKTVLQIKAPANQRVIVKAVKFFGKAAAGGTGVPIKVRLTRSTANFGTAGTTQAVISKNDPTDDETVQTTVGGNFTAEPTTPTDAGLQYEVPDQSGIIEFLPPGQEIKIPGGQALNIEMTSTGTPTVIAQAICEE